MNIYLYFTATVLLAAAAYFIGSKQSKHAFQILCEDNGNFSLVRLIVLFSNIAFIFVFIAIALKTGKLINPSWTLIAWIAFVNLMKVIQKYFESNPEKINDIIQILKRK